MLNTSILMGRLTADPELKYTTSNIPVTSFTLAVDRGYGDEKQTDFINIVAWRQRAEFVSKWFNKGQLVAVEGSIQTRKYKDKNGNDRTAFEVVANNVHFAESKSGNTQPSESAKSQNSGNSANDSDPLYAFDEELGVPEDLPF